MYPLELYEERLLHFQIPKGNEGNLKSILLSPILSCKVGLLRIGLFMHLHVAQIKIRGFFKKVPHMPAEDAVHFEKLISSTIMRAMETKDQFEILDPDSLLVRKYKSYLQSLVRLDNQLSSRINRRYLDREINTHVLGGLRYQKIRTASNKKAMA